MQRIVLSFALTERWGPRQSPWALMEMSSDLAWFYHFTTAGKRCYKNSADQDVCSLYFFSYDIILA